MNHPSGAVNLDAAHGVPADGQISGNQHGRGAVLLGSYSTQPWGGEAAARKAKAERAKKCVANGNTCKGWRASGEQLCAGHLNASRAKDEGAE